MVKMAAYQKEYSKPEQRSVIQFLVAEKCKSCKIYRGMSNAYGEAYFNPKMFTNELNMDLTKRA